MKISLTITTALDYLLYTAIITRFEQTKYTSLVNKSVPKNLTDARSNMTKAW